MWHFFQKNPPTARQEVAQEIHKENMEVLKRSTQKFEKMAEKVEKVAERAIHRGPLSEPGRITRDLERAIRGI